jgi:hypothetical protein
MELVVVFGVLVVFQCVNLGWSIKVGVKGGTLKTILQRHGVSTTGYYDKNELVSLVYQQLMVRCNLEPVDGGWYYAARVFDDAFPELKLMIDTDASVNLLRDQSATRLGLYIRTQRQTQVGMSGSSVADGGAVDLPLPLYKRGHGGGTGGSASAAGLVGFVMPEEQVSVLPVSVNGCSA